MIDTDFHKHGNLGMPREAAELNERARWSDGTLIARVIKVDSHKKRGVVVNRVPIFLIILPFYREGLSQPEVLSNLKYCCFSIRDKFRERRTFSWNLSYVQSRADRKFTEVSFWVRMLELHLTIKGLSGRLEPGVPENREGSLLIAA